MRITSMYRVSKGPSVDELLQLDNDRALLCDAMENRLMRPAPMVDVRNGPHDSGNPTITEERATRQRRHLSLVEQLNTFQDRLCCVLGISTIQADPYEDSRLLGYMTTVEPILGGDEGITTTITYGPRHWVECHSKCYPYILHMVLEGMEVIVHPTTTQDLLIAIGRGYMCLRILAKGTRYYHKEVGIDIPN